MVDGLGETPTEGELGLPANVDRDETPPDPGLGVGFSGEDLDDVSPPVVHDEGLPVGFELDSPLPHLDLGHDVLHGDVGDDLDELEFDL